MEIKDKNSSNSNLCIFKVCSWILSHIFLSDPFLLAALIHTIWLLLNIVDFWNSFGAWYWWFLIYASEQMPEEVTKILV